MDYEVFDRRTGDIVWTGPLTTHGGTGFFAGSDSMLPTKSTPQQIRMDILEIASEYVPRIGEEGLENFGVREKGKTEELQ